MKHLFKKILLINIIVLGLYACSDDDSHTNASNQTAPASAPDSVSKIQTDAEPITLVVKTDSFKVYEFGYGSSKVHCHAGYVLTDKNGKPISISVQ